MNLINYNNNIYPVLYKQISENNYSASINVYDGIAYGKTKEEALINLKNKLNELVIKNNSGKNKMLYG